MYDLELEMEMTSRKRIDTTEQIFLSDLFFSFHVKDLDFCALIFIACFYFLHLLLPLIAYSSIFSLSRIYIFQTGMVCGSKSLIV